MGDRYGRRRILAGTAALAATTLAGCTVGAMDAEETVDEAFDADGVTSVSISGVNGDIALETGTTDQVLIEGTKRASSEGVLDDIALVSDEASETLDVAVEVPSDDGLFGILSGSGAMDLDVVMPESIDDVALDSVNGDVEARGLAGAIDVGTTNGDVAVGGEDLTGVLDSTNGDVEVIAESLDGDLAIDTTNGDVRMELADADGVAVEGTSTTGSVSIDDSVQGVADADAEVSIETVNGDVDVVYTG